MDTSRVNTRVSTKTGQLHNRELAKRCAMRVETFIACCEKLVEAGWVVEGADGPWLNVDAMLPFVDAAVRARNIPRQQPEAVVH